MKNNHDSKLYVRYFDIDYPDKDSTAAPVSPIRFLQPLTGDTIVPVIYIKNRVFLKLDSSSLFLIVKKTDRLITAISNTAGVSPTEIQFDCDWTESTKDRYFAFLRSFKKLHACRLSATIRLHQVKYADRMGIPPVDRGILMFYNIGNIDAGSGNSIYEKSIAAKYIPSIGYYPMPLEVALPVFSWSLLVRNGRVVKLLNKMNFDHFKNDSNFSQLKPNWFSVLHPGFHGGYYFETGDQVKIEFVAKDDLIDLVQQVDKAAKRPVHELIFYDLDKTNLDVYDKDLFREILDRTD